MGDSTVKQFLFICFLAPALALAHGKDSAEKHCAAPPAAAAAAGAGSGTGSSAKAEPTPPRLIPNLGNHVFKVTTKNSRAQQFINQGLIMAYAFNHAEAGRSFAEAARLDPDCAMAYWGQALVLGPTLNTTMYPEDIPDAVAFAKKAVALQSKVSAREKLYIDAMAARYSDKEDADRATLDALYSAAMGAVHEKYPDDVDATTLFVESVMLLYPWNYWLRDGTPKANTLEIAKLLEQVMAKESDHPGALHFYIHLIEPAFPARAEAAADKMRALNLQTGHLLHMPSHIYHQLGRYDDAVKANQLAAETDEAYIKQCRVETEYSSGYYPHNLHFLYVSAMFDGQSKLAISTAKRVAAAVTDKILKERPIMAAMRVAPLFTTVRFGKWDEILKEPAPPRSNVFLTGAWNFARGLALLAKKDTAGAEKSLATLKKLMADKSLDDRMFSDNSARSILSIAPQVLGAEIAASRKQFSTAISLMDTAVRYEDSLQYAEPIEWPLPTRQVLGAILISAGRLDEAESVYWADLKKHPSNGFSYFGLMQAYAAREKQDDLPQIEALFKKSWARADVKLKTSRY